MLILDLWGVSFHAVIVFGLGKNLLFKSIVGRCVDPMISCLVSRSSLKMAQNFRVASGLLTFFTIQINKDNIFLFVETKLTTTFF